MIIVIIIIMIITIIIIIIIIICHVCALSLFEGLKNFCPKNTLPGQASELIAGSLEGTVSPPLRSRERNSRKIWKLVSPRRQEVTFPESQRSD